MPAFHPLNRKLKTCYEVEILHCFDYRMGIKESVEWLVDIMERSKRTEMLRARAGGPGLDSA